MVVITNNYLVIRPLKFSSFWPGNSFDNNNDHDIRHASLSIRTPGEPNSLIETQKFQIEITYIRDQDVPCNCDISKIKPNDCCSLEYSIYCFKINAIFEQ